MYIIMHGHVPYSYYSAQAALEPSDLSCIYIAYHALVIGTVVTTVMYAPLHCVVHCCSMVSKERPCIATGLVHKQGRMATGLLNKQGRIRFCSSEADVCTCALLIFIVCCRCGPMVDLCTGPHLPNTGYLKTQAVNNLSRAFWRADVSKDPLQVR